MKHGPRLPRRPQPDLSRARALLHAEETKSAVTLLRKARQDHPAHAGIALALADALHASGDLSQAVTAYAAALRLDDQSADGWYAAGCAQLALKSYGAAASCLQRAATLAPASAAIHYNFAKTLFELGHVEQSVDHFERAASLDPTLAPMAWSNIACIIPGSNEADNASILAARQRWAATQATAPRSAQATRTGGKHRIGYMSAFFGAQNWMKPVFAVINRHNREDFEIHMFSDGDPPSAGAGYHDRAFDLIYDLRGVDNDGATSIIRAANIDVLVDLNGYSFPARLPVLMHHPASHLVGWFNMFATTGIRAYDWLVGDNSVIPPAEEPHFGEPIHRVPGTYLAFEVLYKVPDVAPPPCINAGARITFGCLGSQYKLTDTVLSAWADIMRVAPNANLFIKNATLQDGSVQQEFLGRLAALGVTADRVTLQGRSPHHAFLDAYRHIDIALDTFPYNGGTTTTEALWQGVPVLTFNGDRWASRTSQSLLLAAGLSDWVMPDRAAYTQRAIELALDPATPGRLASLRQDMRARLATSAACDADGLCRALEDFYAGLVGRKDVLF